MPSQNMWQITCIMVTMFAVGYGTDKQPPPIDFANYFKPDTNRAPSPLGILPRPKVKVSSHTWPSSVMLPYTVLSSHPLLEALQVLCHTT